MKIIRKIYDTVFNKLGHRGIVAVIYAAFLALHILLSMQAYLPSIDPNELSQAAIGAFFTGKDWSAIISKSGYYYGFLPGLLYAPVMLLTNDAFLQYKLMLIVNSIIISFVPAAAYILARKLGVTKPWQLISAALCCGTGAAYIAHTKFIWNETAAIAAPWFFILMIAFAAESRGKVRKCFYSVLAGITAALSCAAHERLWSVVAAALIMILFSLIFYKKTPVDLFGFVPTLIIGETAVKFVERYIQSNLWLQDDPAALANTFENFIACAGENFGNGGIVRLFQSLLGEMYYFCVSTWGLGGIALCAAVFAMSAAVHRRKNAPAKAAAKAMIGAGQKAASKEELATEKLAAEIKTKQGLSMAQFAVFSVFAFVLMLFSGVLYKSGAAEFEDYQDTAMFGRFIDSVSPLLMLFFVVFVCRFGLTLKKLMASTAFLSGVYVLYLTLTEPVTLAAESTRISPVLGIYPLIFGKDIGVLLDHLSIIITISVSFCLTALLIVISCCAGKLKSFMTLLVAVLVSAYSTIYTCVFYLPLCSEESQQKNSAVAEISEYIYNQKDAPAVTLYRTGRHTSLMVRFLNQNITLKYASEADEIEVDTFILANADETIDLHFDLGAAEPEPFVEVKRTSQFVIYAYGKKAAAYLASQT